MSDFTVDIERETDGRWIGEVSELPGVLVYGSTRDEAVAKANATAKEAEKPIRSASFSPDGVLLATVGDDGAIHTWDAASGAAVEVYDASSALTGVAFVDASHVVVTGKSGAVKWNVGIRAVSHGRNLTIPGSFRNECSQSGCVFAPSVARFGGYRAC